GIGAQPCPFCANAGATASRAPRLGPPGAAGTYVSMAFARTNHPHLEITDGNGQRIGFSGGHVVNTIPGAQMIWPQASDAQRPLGLAPIDSGSTPTEPWLQDPEPIYWIPGSH